MGHRSAGDEILGRVGGSGSASPSRTQGTGLGTRVSGPQGSGLRIEDSGVGIQDSGFRILDSEFGNRDSGSGLGTHDPGLRIPATRLKTQD